MKTLLKIFGMAAALLPLGCEFPTGGKSTPAPDTLAVQSVFLSDSGQTVEGEHVVTLADGGFAVAWTQYAWLSTKGEIRIATFTADGKKDKDFRFTPPPGPTYYGQLSLAPLPDGGFAVAWISKDDLVQNDAVYLYSQDWNEPRRASDSLVVDMNLVSLTALSNGRLILGHNGTSIATTEYPAGIWFRQFDASGTLVDSFSTVYAQNSGHNLYGPLVAGLGNGGWIGLWGDQSLGFVGQAFSADGPKVGEMLRWGACWAYNSFLSSSRALDGSLYIGDGQSCAMLLDGNGNWKNDFSQTTVAKVAVDAKHRRTWAVLNDSLVALDSNFNRAGARPLPPSALSGDPNPDFAANPAGKIMMVRQAWVDGDPSRYLKVLAIDAF